MNQTLPEKKHSIPNLAVHKIILIPLIGFFLCLNSCHKEEKKNGLTPQGGNQNAPLQLTAIRVLKVHATAKEFNDLDWNNTTISSLNGAPYLLKIPSKSNPAKFLFYNKTNNVTHARWVQIKTGTASSSESITVSSLNESHRKESLLSNGRISSSQRFVNNVLVTNQGSAAKNKTLAKNVKKAGPTAFDEEGCPPPVVEPDASFARANSLDDDGGFDGGDGCSGDDGGGDSGGDPGSTDPGSTDPGTTTTNPDSMPPGMLPEVTITAPGPDNSSITLYSLYLLMGNNPTYANQYTTSPTGGAGGQIVTVTPTASAVDAANAEFVADGKPAVDPNKLINCFTDGKTAKGYKMTIYVDQPVPGSNAQWRTDIAALPTGAVFMLPGGQLIDVGHTFVGFEKDNTDGTSVTQVMGFYPGGSGIASKGVIKDDSGHPYNVSYTINVTASQFNAGLSGVVNDSAYSNYILSNWQPGTERNCTDAAISWIDAAGQIFSAAPRGPFVNTPGDFGQDLSSVSGASTTAGTAPQGHGPCN